MGRCSFRYSKFPATKFGLEMILIQASPELDDDGTQMHQLLIGSPLGHLDVATAVMTMSGYHTNPREGHLCRLKRVVEHLSEFKHAVLQHHVKYQDHSHLDPQVHDWDPTLHGNVKEELSNDPIEQ